MLRAFTAYFIKIKILLNILYSILTYNLAYNNNFIGANQYIVFNNKNKDKMV